MPAFVAPNQYPLASCVGAGTCGHQDQLRGAWRGRVPRPGATGAVSAERRGAAQRGRGAGCQHDSRQSTQVRTSHHLHRMP